MTFLASWASSRAARVAVALLCLCLSVIVPRRGAFLGVDFAPQLAVNQTSALSASSKGGCPHALVIVGELRGLVRELPGILSSLRTAHCLDVYAILTRTWVNATAQPEQALLFDEWDNAAIAAVRALAPVAFELGDMVASFEPAVPHIWAQFPPKCVADGREINRGKLVYNTLRQFCKLARAADLIDDHARARGVPYATVFKTRPGPMFLVLPMTVDLDDESISVEGAPFVAWNDLPGKRWWSSEAQLDGAVVTHTVVVPCVAWWHGVNDQIAFGRAAEMLRFLRDPLLRSVEMCNHGVPLNSELITLKSFLLGTQKLANAEPASTHVSNFACFAAFPPEPDFKEFLGPSPFIHTADSWDTQLKPASCAKPP